jgi:hypothetical protein
MQRMRKKTTRQQPLLGSDKRATKEVLLDVVLSILYAPRLYYSTDRIELGSAVRCNAMEWSDVVGD